MKPVTDMPRAHSFNGLLLGLMIAGGGVAMGSQANADVPEKPATPPPVGSLRADASPSQLNVRVFELAENGNPLRLKVLAQPVDDSRAASAKALQGARLGIALTKVPDAVRAQFNTDDLPAGFGVMVQEVSEESPAAKAGLEPFDILVKFDDQKLVSGEQLVALVNAAEAKRPVAITLLRKGRRKVVKARLAGAATMPQQGDADAAKDAPGAAAIPGLPTIPGLPPQVNDLLKQLPESGFQIIGGDGQAFQGTVVMQASTVMATDDGTVTITDNDGNRSVTITDKSGKEIYSGPLNTADEWAKVPKGFRNQIPKP